MDACDRSTGQLREASRFMRDEGIDVDLAVADGRALPYPDAHFDFAYAVNVLHHVTEPGGRERALGEIVRVLKPGGSFFLHEINTDNPVFAFYMGYMFPLLRDIDDGTELWIKPSGLPEVEGARWDSERSYFTFLPDFIPPPLLKLFSGLERGLERSRLRSWSAHFVARLVREDPPPGPGSRHGSEARERAE
jgi:SAM-dependent methyltransferase